MLFDTLMNFIHTMDPATFLMAFSNQLTNFASFSLQLAGQPVQPGLIVDL
ncbi:hypothetical protein DCCM_2817 [Desulfocucumis palustris]|uniref:Uncharacterized protein n=1 Tax=Desulfocucumis palustris TaxID=1898651 RepID=A0A2L2XII0_9FIRM|nr:hypothetical protein DCCM_2817 [Desulfocucumis palustris]